MSLQPFQANGTPDGPRRCGRCGQEAPADAGRCPQCQSFLRGNQEARVSGQYARLVPTELQAAAEELVTGIVADMGGLTEMSTLERAIARKLGDLEVLSRTLANDIAERGLLTSGGGKVRPSFDAFISALTAFDRYTQRLGLKRRARHVDQARALEAFMTNQGDDRC